MTKPKLKTLISKRDSVISSVNRFKLYFETTDFAKKGILQLQLRLKKCEENWTEFFNIQEQIEQLDPSEDQKSERDIFEDTYFELVAEVQTFINQNQANTSLPPAALSPAQATAHPINLTAPQELAIKLPAISLPTFSGNIEEWFGFKDLFQALIIDNTTLTDIQRFQYLRASIKGDAAKVIQSLEFTSVNFTVAWKSLVSRYHNERVIVNRHVSSLFNLQSIEKESSHSLRLLLDSAQTHIRALKALDQPTDTWDTLLLHLISSKLDSNTRRDWESSISSDLLPTWNSFTDFLSRRCHTLESLESNKLNFNKKVQPNMSKPVANTSKQTTSRSCLLTQEQKCRMCSYNHPLYRCEQFLKLSITDRIAQCKQLNLCLNCLRHNNHSVKNCQLSGCRKCKRQHNTLLHLSDDQHKNKPENKPESNTADEQPSTAVAEGRAQLEQQNTTFTGVTRYGISSQVLLSTALVEVVDSKGEFKTRVLLDSASQTNFITEKLAQRLGLKRMKTHLSIQGINQATTSAKQSVKCTVRSLICSFNFSLECLILPSITQELPSRPINKDNICIPNTIQLADPNFNSPGTVDMLIGAEWFWQLLSIGQIRLAQQMILQKTVFGWVISGRAYFQDQNSQLAACYHTSVGLEQQLEKFWSLDDCPNLKNKPLTQEEQRCEDIFLNTYQRDSTGRFIVHLPLKQENTYLGDSKNTAQLRFLQLERRLERNIEMKQLYHDFIRQYLELGHMQPVPENGTDSSSMVFYLPHHPVMKEESTTTKLRVVFDASATTSSGKSLNDILIVGAIAQLDLITIILRFRLHAFVMTADIAKMFRQINVHPKHTNLQRILWRNESDEPIQVYKLTTVTYGTASAPFLATRCLEQLAIEERDRFPLASAVTMTDFYMDDLMTGCDSIATATKLQTQLIEMLNSGGFELRKWCANHPQLIANVPSELRSSYQETDANQVIKTLGLLWNPSTDEFYYSIKLEDKYNINKRSVLSDIAHVYDPLGLIGPLITKAKIFMQRLWLINLNWDESLPCALHMEWQLFRDDLKNLTKLSIPRRALYTYYNLQIHGFGDASEAAYGACLYLRCSDSHGTITTALLCSKSKVAPIKTQSLPRLELCAALTLARLHRKVCDSLNLNIHKSILWSDSTITLSWIRAPSIQWKTFVANRVSEIQELTCNSEWRHISSQDNAADVLSRGLSVNQLIDCKLWWFGPSWLQNPEHSWPISVWNTESTLPEARTVHISAATTTNKDYFLISRYSSLRTLIRVTAYIFRFYHNVKNRNNQIKNPLSPEELKVSLHRLIILAQNQEYARDINNLKQNQELHHKSKLLSLHPFLDDSGLLRVGGRLENSILEVDKKHPIILPPSHTLTYMIVSFEHKQQLHAGPQALLNHIRQKYWLINGRSFVRNVVHKCIKCFRAKPIPASQIMGQLPSTRVRPPARPFTNVGVDYCGPFYARTAKRKGLPVSKMYVSLFVCLATKAIHLELVEDLTTESFMAALRRFMSRRGKPAQMHSDNGTNFVGANRELEELRALWQSENHRKQIQSTLTDEGITWIFIPPNSPHFGGLWEAGVRLIKYHLRRVVGKANLTYFELITILTQVEACVNSRPLTPLTPSPSDLTVLTPAHFLIGGSLVMPPEPDLQEVPINRLSRWQFVQQTIQQFWSRWTREYLAELQTRTKWKTSKENLKIGTLVLIREDNTRPLDWRLGRVEELHPGADGRLRVVTLKTATGPLKRPIHKLCPLPQEDDN